MIRAILTDIEGTTTPIAFVQEVMFPFAAAALDPFLDARGETPEVAALLRAVPGPDPRATLRAWMAADAKETPLKTLQGLIWAAGFADGRLKGAMYADVAPALRAWSAAGIPIHIYSSGSIAAQKLLFGHAVGGDLTRFLAGHFDTTTGPKRAAESYAAIARALAVPAGTLLFLSDIAEELDAAAAAGLACCQLLRPGDGTTPCGRHAQAADFNAVARRFGLPLPPAAPSLPGGN